MMAIEDSGDGGYGGGYEGGGYGGGGSLGGGDSSTGSSATGGPSLPPLNPGESYVYGSADCPTCVWLTWQPVQSTGEVTDYSNPVDPNKKLADDPTARLSDLWAKQFSPFLTPNTQAEPRTQTVISPANSAGGGSGVVIVLVLVGLAVGYYFLRMKGKAE